jgi:hypothetical protein
LSIDIKHTSQESENLIIFIHGLGGDIESFKNNDNIMFHKYLDKSILNKCDIGYYKYTSKIISSRLKSLLSNISNFIGKEINHDISEIAEILKTDYNHYITKYKTINFICHSMGGLIIKDLLLNKNLDFQYKPFYITLATPHFGSNIANKLIIINSKHEHIKTLKTDSNTLVQLNTKFIEKKNLFNRKYYYALDDQIVLKNSSCSEGDEIHRVAVRGNHISISKPNSDQNSQTLLHDINRTIIDYLNIDINNQEIIKNNTIDLILFDSYNNEKKDYYLKREIDNKVENTLSMNNIWIHGESGTGKTNIAQYYMFSKNIDFFHSVYFTDPTICGEDYFTLIYESLFDRLDDDNNKLTAKNLIQVLCFLSKKYNKVIIHLDELSDLGEEVFKIFFTNFIDILTNQRANCNIDNINFIVTTLFNPSHYIDSLNNKSYQEKLKNKFTILKLEKWTNSELIELYNIISNNLSLKSDILDKIDTLNGEPRELKYIIRTEILNRKNNE